MGDDLPVEIIKGLRGVLNAFYLDKNILSILKDEEASVVKATMDVGVTNEGFNEALLREKVICVVKDTRFRPPPAPTVILRGNDGALLGEEVFPHTMHLYEGREDLIWMGDGFVVFPHIEVKGGEKFVMPPIAFPELNEGNGCTDVISCSPAPTSDLKIKNYYGLKDDPRLATILVAFNKR
ncbi:MAG: hypothetical protein LBV13_02100 [Methanomassiliicoccaceae archaeon]|jgi:hypothetical protein|nr:hypothetical protein [Methanomassiliicoccaceae archaeon]